MVIMLLSQGSLGGGINGKYHLRLVFFLNKCQSDVA